VSGEVAISPDYPNIKAGSAGGSDCHRGLAAIWRRSGEVNVDQPMTNDDRSSTAVIEWIVRSIEEDIVLGRLRPRQRLLEDELTTKFAAKRHLVRTALGELEGMGIIVREPNRGATVRDLTPEEVEHIYAVRELLECHAASLIPLPASDELIEKLTAIHVRYYNAVDEGNLPVIFRANVDFHRALFAACGNPFLATQISQLVSRVHAIRFQFVSEEGLIDRARHSREEHGMMIDYLRSGDRQKLVELVARHILPSKNNYLRLASSHWR
jgi:DNA-binding GntR family transcriptional regulator